MKKIIPFIVLWVFLSGSGGCFFVFRIKQYLNYSRLEQSTRNKSREIVLQVLVFDKASLNSLKWIKKQKEFNYKGQLYDIVSCKISGNQIYYSCINDTKEKKLIKDFENKNRAHNRANEITRKIIQSHFILPSPAFTVFEQPSVFYFIQPAHHYSPPVNSTLSPPPKSFWIA